MESKKLDPEFKAKWVAALRSGEYKQGVGVLYSPVKDSYCCLGVGCAVAGMEKSELDGNCGFGDNAYMYEIPPPTNMKPVLEVQNTLMFMNDDDGKSFSKIADWIDANL